MCIIFKIINTYIQLFAALNKKYSYCQSFPNFHILLFIVLQEFVVVVLYVKLEL